MRGLSPLLSGALALSSCVGTGLTVAQSLKGRGVRDTALFAALGVGLPAIAEYRAVNGERLLRHHMRPRVPIPALLGWYDIIYASYTVAESLGNRGGAVGGVRSLAVASLAAVVATSLDLMLDPAGLDLGLWEWTHGGRYAAHLAGPNGEKGIPATNFVGWAILAGGVSFGYQAATSFLGAGHRTAGVDRGGREAALLLASYYLPAVGWGVWRRERRYILYSLPCAGAVAAGLVPSAA